MGHGLIEVNGQIEAMFAGERPWHGLGVQVTERQTPMEALRLANLDWKVEKKTLQYLHDAGGVGLVDDKVATVRADTGAYLGTVGLQYTPLQNREQAEFIEVLAGEGAVVDCCGALFGGRKTFWTVKLDDVVRVGSNDTIEKNLIVANAHDGSMGFRAFWSPIRVVCNNTLNASLKGAKDGINVRHTSNIKDRIKQAQTILTSAREYYNKAEVEFNRMAEREVTKDEASAFLEAVFGIDDDEKRESTKWANTKEQLRASCRTEMKSMESQTPTAWLMYNTVTRYTSHDMTRRNTTRLNDPNERRFESVLFGRGKRIQQSAYQEAMKLVTMN